MERHGEGLMSVQEVSIERNSPVVQASASFQSIPESGAMIRKTRRQTYSVDVLVG